MRNRGGVGDGAYLGMKAGQELDWRRTGLPGHIEAGQDFGRCLAGKDPHSPRRFRIIGPLRNLDAWYDAFKVGPESKFYIAPEKRVRIW